jgi:hypothetical protein
MELVKELVSMFRQGLIDTAIIFTPVLVLFLFYLVWKCFQRRRELANFMHYGMWRGFK